MYSECVYVALIIQHVKCMCYITLSSVACPGLPYFSALWYDMIWYDIFVNCNWIDTQWQWYSTNLHTNNTQYNTMKQNTQKGTYITIRIHKHNNKNT